MKSTLIFGVALAVLGLPGCSNEQAVAQENNDSAAIETAPAAAAAGIAGTWKVDPAAVQFQDKKPYSLTVKDGKWSCNSCLPPFSVPADGKWHKVSRPVADEIMVSVVDDKTIRTAARKGGKDLGNTVWTVGADGASMAMVANDAAWEGSQPVTRKASYRRDGEAMAGAHMASGNWFIAKVDEVSDAGRTFTVTLDGDKFGVAGNGNSYVATLGGEAVAIVGDPGGATAKVEKLGENDYRETIIRKGETIEVNRMTLAPDGTLKLESTDPRTGNMNSATATRG